MINERRVRCVRSCRSSRNREGGDEARLRWGELRLGHAADRECRAVGRARSSSAAPRPEGVAACLWSDERSLSSVLTAKAARAWSGRRRRSGRTASGRYHGGSLAQRQRRDRSSTKCQRTPWDDRSFEGRHDLASDLAEINSARHSQGSLPDNTLRLISR